MSESIFLFTLFFLYGICIGSFLNVVIYRLPRKIPISKGRSMCPKCEHTLGVLDLFPIFSWLFLRAKCRYCGAKISGRYPLVELLTGVSFGLSSVAFGLSFYAIILCLFCAILITAWFIDLDFSYLPDRLSVLICILAVLSLFTGPDVSILDRLIGGIGIGAFMWIIAFFTKGGIGGGDIKLMASSGLLLGWQLILPAFFAAYLFAATCYLPSLIKKKIPANFEVPMAPFFAVSLMIFSLFGRQLITAYFSLL